MLGLLVLAIAPAVALFFFFYLRDKYQKEPLGLLLLTFGLGAASLVPAALTSLCLQKLTGWPDTIVHVASLLWEAVRTLHIQRGKPRVTSMRS